MIVERSMQPDWLSNAYLVGDEEGGTGVVIDSGGPSEPLLEAADRHGLDVRLLLLTHHHADHVAENHVWKERHGVEIVAHPLEAARLLDVDRTIEPGEPSRPAACASSRCTRPGTRTGCSTSWSAARCSPATRSSRAPWAACGRRDPRASRTSSTRSWTC